MKKQMAKLERGLEELRTFLNVQSLKDTMKTEGSLATFNWEKGGAVGKGIYQDENVAILLIDVEPESVHPAHGHKETEILIVLEGAAVVKLVDRDVILEKHSSRILSPDEVHEVFYPIKSQIIAITVPADKNFPKGV